jgi:hypothetical protein
MTEETMLAELESFLPEIINTLLQTTLTSDMIGKICEMLIKETINQICTTWINDSDTTIGMECDWTDWLIQEIPLNPSSSKYIEEALAITDENEFTKIYVEHKQYGKQDIYITVIDNSLIFSTKYKILYNYCIDNIS